MVSKAAKVLDTLAQQVIRVVRRPTQPRRRHHGPSRTLSIESLESRLPLSSATIHGLIYNDIDGDGIKDPGENGLSGWTAYIDEDGNGSPDAGEPTTTSTASGEYTFSDLGAGTYSVRQVDTLGWRQTAPASSNHVVTVGGSSWITGVDFGNVQLFRVSGQTVDVIGTSEDDSFRFIINPVPKVTINDRLYVLDQFAVTTINFHGNGGSDTATLIGTAADDHVDLAVASATLSTPNVVVHTVGVETNNVYSGGGRDTAVMHDSTGNDRFAAHPTWARLSGGGSSNFVHGFSQVDADATAGGDDRAYFHDSGGDDRFTSRPEWARLQGAGFSNYASGFGRVYAYASAGGNNDRAYLYGSTGRDAFYGRPAYGLLRGQNFEHYSYAESFDRVYAYARSGFDLAYLYESSSDDRLYGRPDYSILRGNDYEFYNYANGFDRVYAYAGSASGDDRAYLYDSAGDDNFTGRPGWARLRSGGFFNHADGFNRVYAYATEGGNDDRADLYDGPTVDVLVAKPDYALLRGDNFEFYNYANGFDHVEAFATVDGNSDRAMLFDSGGNDLFFGQSVLGSLTGSGFSNSVTQFDEVAAVSTAGGTDILDLNDVGFTFQQFGDWVSPPSNTTITLDSATTYQTMGHDFDGDGQYAGAWEATYWAGNSWEPAFPNYIDELFDKAIDVMNIDRVRLTILAGAENDTDHWSDWQDSGGSTNSSDPARQRWIGNRYATDNDNNNPFSINWNGFHFADLDDKIDNFIVPLRDKLASRGRELYVNLNYIAFNGQITDPALDYHHTRDPEEYAEFILATYLHIQSKYGFVPDSLEVILEPDNTGGQRWPKWNPEFIADAIVATAQRLESNGFTPRFSAPSNSSIATIDQWIDRMVAQNPQVLNYLNEISYHSYGGNTISDRQNVADRASQYGLTTAQLEYLNARTQDLHYDLKYANVSTWSKYTFFALFSVNTSNPNNPTVTLRNDAREFRQYMKFIKAGAQRIEATSQDGQFDPLAFIDTDGKYVVLVKASGSGTFSVGGLPPAVYGVNYSTPSQFDVDLADVPVGTARTLDLSIPHAGVYAIYQK